MISHVGNPPSRDVLMPRPIEITPAHRHVLSAFRAKHDTLTIAALMRLDEALVYRLLAQAREAERQSRG